MGYLRALLGRAEIRTLLANSGWLLGDRVVRVVANFAAGILLARYLAPEKYGLFVYSLAFAALFLPFSTLGLERIAVREYARDAAKPDTLLGTLGLVRLLGGCAGAAVATLAAWLMGAGTSPEVRLMIAVLAGANVLLAFDVIDWLFQSRNEFRPTTVVRCATAVIGAAVRIVLAWRRAPLPWLAYATVGEFGLSAILQTIVYRQRGARVTALRFQWATARLLLKASAPLLLGEVAVSAFLKLDLVILGANASPAETGFYGAAIRLAQASFFFPMIALQVLSPQIARCAGEAEALAAVQRVMNLLLASALAISLALFAGAPLFVRLLFGAGYAPVAPLLGVLAWSNVFAFMGCGHSLYLINRGHQNAAFVLNLLSSAVSIALFFALIPRWGATGAAIAGVAAGAITTTPALWLLPASRPLVRVDFAALRWVLGLPWRLVRGQT